MFKNLLKFIGLAFFLFLLLVLGVQSMNVMRARGSRPAVSGVRK